MRRKNILIKKAMNGLPKIGRRERSLYGDESLSITELLRKPGVSEYLQRNGSLTYESQRNKLRRELRARNFTKEVVDEFPRQQQHQRQWQEDQDRAEDRRSGLTGRTARLRKFWTRIPAFDRRTRLVE